MCISSTHSRPPPSPLLPTTKPLTTPPATACLRADRYDSGLPLLAYVPTGLLLPACLNAAAHPFPKLCTFLHGYRPLLPAYLHGYHPLLPAYLHGYRPLLPAYLHGYRPLRPAYLLVLSKIHLAVSALMCAAQLRCEAQQALQVVHLENPCPCPRA